MKQKMKKDCTLIATLPSLSNKEKVESVISHPYISEVRFNTGTPIMGSVEGTLEELKKLAIRYQKKLWIDIKGRQLRVAKWADPLYSCIELNHKIQVLYPAFACFRNGDKVKIMHVKDGNKLFVDPLPKQALGAGQSVNILAKDLEIEGYLTNQDKEYLVMCKKLNLPYIMASYVETPQDVSEILEIWTDAQIVCKIESQKGMGFVLQNGFSKLQNVEALMAARDDLYIESEQSYKMLYELQGIIAMDSRAICASKIFLSLEKRECVDWADFADLELMYRIGYRRFMLCDNICNYRFEAAMKGWRDFING